MIKEAHEQGIAAALADLGMEKEAYIGAVAKGLWNAGKGLFNASKAGLSGARRAGSAISKKVAPGVYKAIPKKTLGKIGTAANVGLTGYTAAVEAPALFRKNLTNMPLPTTRAKASRRPPPTMHEQLIGRR